MLTDEESVDVVRFYFPIKLSLRGWTYELLEELENDRFGYTDFDRKVIQISKAHWPTLERNVRELVLHEASHALCGHGKHNLEWWDLLISMGGRGVWVDEHGEIDQARITD